VSSGCFRLFYSTPTVWSEKRSQPYCTSQPLGASQAPGASQPQQQRRQQKHKRQNDWSWYCSSSSSEDEDDGQQAEEPTLSGVASELLEERIETQATQLTVGGGDFVAVLAEDPEGEYLWSLLRLDSEPRKMTADEAAEWNARLGEGEDGTYEAGQWIVTGQWLEHADAAHTTFYAAGPGVAFSYLIIMPVDLLPLPPAPNGTPLFALPRFMDETLTAAAREVISSNRIV